MRKQETSMSSRPFLAATLCTMMVFIAQFALLPINMAGGMTLSFPLTALEINIPIMVILGALLFIVGRRTGAQKAMVWILSVSAVAMFIVTIYYFFDTNVLEGKKAKPDLGRFYPQDDINFWYAVLVSIYFSFLAVLIFRKKSMVR